MRTRLLTKSLLWASACLLLALVFAAYTRPDFMRMLADLMWSCF